VIRLSPIPSCACSSAGVFALLQRDRVLSFERQHQVIPLPSHVFLGIEVPLVSIVLLLDGKQDTRYAGARDLKVLFQQKSPDTGVCGTPETETFFVARRDLFLAHATTPMPLCKTPM
jgi:hypothetical protein